MIDYESIFVEEYYLKIVEYEDLFSAMFGHKNTSLIYLLSMLDIPDSLLKCVCKLKKDELYNKIKEKYCTYKEEENIEKLISYALKIAKEDRTDLITDEHMLYAIINHKNYNAYDILESIGINTTDLLSTLKEYFNDEDDYLVNITSKVRENEVDKFIGMKDIITKIILILYKRKKSNLILIGPAGVGKSSIVYEVARELINQNRNEEIVRLDLGLLIAGTRYRGDLEERIEKVINQVKKKKWILFIDEIHMLLGDQSKEDTFNIANLLKPILSSGEIKCIGATTQEEYTKFIENDRAFQRRFENVYITEPTEEETYDILRQIKDTFETYYNIKYSKNILKDIVHYSKLLKDRHNPDKSIDILDETGSLVAFHKRKIVTKKDIQKVVLGRVKSLKNEINELSFYKEKYLNGDCDKRIASVCLVDKNCNKYEKIKNIANMFEIDKRDIIYFDTSEEEEKYYINMLKSIKHAKASVLVLENYDKANNINIRRINRILRSGYDLLDELIKVSFQNTIFIMLNENINFQIGYESKAKILNNCDVYI